MGLVIQVSLLSQSCTIQHFAIAVHHYVLYAHISAVSCMSLDWRGWEGRRDTLRYDVQIAEALEPFNAAR
jgi:hypothetical protein